MALALNDLIPHKALIGPNLNERLLVLIVHFSNMVQKAPSCPHWVPPCHCSNSFLH